MSRSASGNTAGGTGGLVGLVKAVMVALFDEVSCIYADHEHNGRNSFEGDCVW